mmetsp:Transcript_678/g.2283  ORF Transcript_678/g.2283 Transcript_678/m.2283 type:complete len:88 (+) Transcript_678:176-439(+)
MGLMGGFGDDKPIDDDVKALVEALKAEILAAAGAAETDALEALSYTSQVVAGTNFRVKLKVGGKEVTAQIFRPLPHTGEPASLKECA